MIYGSDNAGYFTRLQKRFRDDAREVPLRNNFLLIPVVGMVNIQSQRISQSALEALVNSAKFENQ